MANVESNTPVSQLAGKYLTFALSNEQYGVHILKVQEIIGVMHVTRVPSCPKYLKGVINLRGRIIPVVDLRLKFGIEEIPYDAKTCIIVVDIQLGLKRMPVGIVVDTVLEVANLSESMIEPPPEYGSDLDTQFLIGMGRGNQDEVIILIDIEKALSDAVDLQTINK